MNISKVAAEHHLAVLGTCAALPEDAFGQGTLVLLGPAEPGFWHHVSKSAELNDGKPDPLDRWSKRTIEKIAGAVGGTALFPFGEPRRPFMTWALRSGSAWASPVGLLVHERAGLLVSYRGAVLLPDPLQPNGSEKPCPTCSQPCKTACPVGALTTQGYDLEKCHAYLDQPEGADCLNAGCKVRRACPVSQTYPRATEQNAFHMAAFHPVNRN